MAFRHLFSFRQLWLQALVSIHSESCKSLPENHASLCQSSFPSLSSPTSEVVVLFDRNLRRRPFFRQVVDLNLLLCKGFDTVLADFYWCLIFTERPINDCKIELRNERGSDLLKVLAKFIENSLSRAKKEIVFTVPNLPSSIWNETPFDSQIESYSRSATGFSPRFRRVYPREISCPSSVQPWKIPVLLAIHRQSRSHWESLSDPSAPILWFMDVSVTEANLNNASFHKFSVWNNHFFSCNMAKIQFSCRF